MQISIIDGIKWSDGQPVTAGDFVFAFQRLVDPKNAA
ncbi:ABC transporter substrate-binding protein, partial [Rhizobium leguminosarum]